MKNIFVKETKRFIFIYFTSNLLIFLLFRDKLQLFRNPRAESVQFCSDENGAAVNVKNFSMALIIPWTSLHWFGPFSIENY